MTHQSNNPVKFGPAGLGKYQIFLVEDHPVTRKGLVRIINQEPDLEVCGEAATATQAMEQIEARLPDLVIVDISLKSGASGLELIKNLSSRHAGLLMLVLSTHDEKLYAERALRAGARGYLMKSEPVNQVMQGIRKILRGEKPLSEAMNGRLLQKRPPHQSSSGVFESERLSDRELEIYGLIGRGWKTRQIASDLKLSVSTVETYRAHIKQKLHIHNASQLVQHAVEWSHSQRV